MDAELRELLETMRRENAAAWQANETRWEANDAAHSATRAHADALFAVARADVADLRRHIDIRFEEQGAHFDRLAEGMTLLDEKVDRRSDALDEKIERATADTQALIRYAHRDLDERVRTLEQH